MALHPVSVSRPGPVGRFALSGGLAAVVCAPILCTPFLWGLGFGAEQTTGHLAYCPPNEVLDPSSGACRPETDQAPPTFNPINPENAPLQPGSITSSRPGEVGQLPEVNGIPCNGDNTGLCIGLTEENNALDARPGIPGDVGQ